MMTLKQLGKLIAKKRKQAGYSQEDFAKEIKVGRSYMGRIERGEVNFGIRTFIKICEAIND